MRPRAGKVTEDDSPIPAPIGKPTNIALETPDSNSTDFRTILVENIPQQWSPQFFYQCFTAYGNPTGCFIYEDIDSQGFKKGLIEMANPRTASMLCQNTGFLLLPNNVTVKVTLTSISNFSGWVKMHTQWLMYQQMWNYNYSSPEKSGNTSASLSSNTNGSTTGPSPDTSSKKSQDAPKDTPNTNSKPSKTPAIVKASNVDMKAFKNSDEMFETFKNVFGELDTSAIASINSDNKAIIVFKVPDLEHAKSVKKDFDWYTFPGSPPEIDFPVN